MKNYVVFGLLLDLLKYKFIPAKFLSQKYELSTRTIYRYLDELESAGIQTYTKVGKNGGIGIEPNLILDTITLSSNERTYLKQQLEYVISTKNNLCDKQLCEILIKKLNL